MTADGPFLFWFFFSNPCFLHMMLYSSSQQKTCICSENVISVLEGVHVSVFMSQLSWLANRILGGNVSTCIDKYLDSKNEMEQLSKKQSMVQHFKSHCKNWPPISATILVYSSQKARLS